MASSGKKKTTMAKLMRESRLRERRLEKQAKREARKQATADGPDQLEGTPYATGGGPEEPAAVPPAAVPPAVGTVADAQPDA
jgi:hypothetical protein